MVETGGHLSINDVPARVIRIVDVKCPGSGESAKNHWENLDLLTRGDEVKFVIRIAPTTSSRATWSRVTSSWGAPAAVLFSPVHGVLAAKDLAAWILADRLPVRLQLQAHKYIWGADVRGRLGATFLSRSLSAADSIRTRRARWRGVMGTSSTR